MQVGIYELGGNAVMLERAAPLDPDIATDRDGWTRLNTRRFVRVWCYCARLACGRSQP